MRFRFLSASCWIPNIQPQWRLLLIGLLFSNRCKKSSQTRLLMRLLGSILAKILLISKPSTSISRLDSVGNQPCSDSENKLSIIPTRILHFLRFYVVFFYVLGPLSRLSNSTFVSSFWKPSSPLKRTRAINITSSLHTYFNVSKISVYYFPTLMKMISCRINVQNIYHPCVWPAIGVLLQLQHNCLYNWPIVPAPDDDGRWWMMMSVEQSVECLAGETEVLGEKLPRCRFVHHKSHMTWAGLETGG
jgi:hypothetical protein